MSSKGQSSSSLLRLPNNDVADCILFMKKSDQAVCILGSACLRKVVGKLTIHGHYLVDNKWHPICSSGTNLVTLQCSSGARIKYSSELLSEIVDDATRENIKVNLGKTKDVGCIVLLKANRLLSRLQYEELVDVATVNDDEDDHFDYKELPRKTADLGFTVFFDVPSALSSLIVSPCWTSCLELIQSHRNRKDTSSPIILICGAKNVGKSTFARYLMNHLLNTQKSLYYMESDVGQSEFTPPGILSLTKVDTPIFGPPFVHLSKPERALFFGNITPKDCPSTYVQMIDVLYRHYSENCQQMPLIVNTCGWVKGLGVRILLDVIRITQPTHIIQIDSNTDPMKNLPALTEEFLLSEEGWTDQTGEKRFLRQWSRIIHQMNAFKNFEEISKSQIRLRMQASDLRSLSLLSYFGSEQDVSSVESVQEYIMKHSTVHSISLDHIELYSMCDDVSSDEILHSIIGSVVGLIRSDKVMNDSTDVINSYSLTLDNVHFGDCVGLGIVRNIDAVKRVAYIITPEPLDILRTVHVLLKGRIEILECLYKKNTCRKLPFLTLEFSYNHRGAGRKRIRYNLLRQKSPHSPRQDLEPS